MVLQDGLASTEQLLRDAVVANSQGSSQQQVAATLHSSSRYEPLHSTGGGSYQQLTALLEDIDHGCRVAALLRARPAQQAQPSLTAAQVVQEYTASLQRSAQAEAAAGCSTTNSQAAAVCHEFIAFLRARQTARGATLLNCSPVDVKVFFESQWLSQHGSLLLSDGQQYAAPSYLSTSISHLSGLFKRLGRTGEYDPVRQVGNPCLDPSIAAFKTAYSRQLWALGYAECSAVSLTFDKYSRLLQRLQQLAVASASKGQAMETLVLQRDQLCFAAEWCGAVRGKNAGSIQLAEVQDLRGQSLADRLQSSTVFPFPVGFQWQWAPNGTKPRQQRRAGVLPPISVLPASEGYREPLRLLHVFVQNCRSSGISTNSYLLRPQTADRQGFKDTLSPHLP